LLFQSILIYVIVSLNNVFAQIAWWHHQRRGSYGWNLTRAAMAPRQPCLQAVCHRTPTEGPVRGTLSTRLPSRTWGMTRVTRRPSLTESPWIGQIPSQLGTRCLARCHTALWCSCTASRSLYWSNFRTMDRLGHSSTPQTKCGSWSHETSSKH
jgi:hypothetical protein